jgi:arginase family enzyme
MREILDRGIADVLAEAIDAVGPGPAFASIDVDVLDPAFAPGTGTPEPGGMNSADLLWACRELAAQLELVGADVVEVIPSAPLGIADSTALVAARIAHELLTGLALHRG